LRSPDLSVEIDPLGAELSILRDAAGRDLLWNGDAAVWAGRAPVLFPIVGALAGGAYRLGGRAFPLGRHGFARGKAFRVLEHTSQDALLRLTADSSTLEVYPFPFELDVRFTLADATLAVRMEVRNTGMQNLPASLGFHPGLRWPLPYGQPREEHFIELDSEEPDPVRRVDAAGLVTPQGHPTPIAGRQLALEDSLFRDDALIFDRIRSRSVTYGASRGPRIRVGFPDAPFLGVWTKPGAPFICIEPWHGLADAQGFSGEIWDKAGMRSVAPGATAALNVTLALLP
jgi:galactose mutarotase-like enzyme